MTKVTMALLPMIVLWLTALAGCCAATRPSSTRLHGFETMGSARATSRSGRTPPATGRPVVFPTSGEQRPRLDARGMPACAVHELGKSAYCVEDDSYPAEIVRNVMWSLNVSDMENLNKEILARSLPSHVGSLEVNVCASKHNTIYPKTARSTDYEWLYVINDANYVPAINIEACAYADAPCDMVDINLPTGYSTACQQKFAHFKLLALHPTEQKVYAKDFHFPSCCVCYVKSPQIAGRSLNPSRRRRN